VEHGKPVDLSALGDEALALALKQGQDAAFDELVRRHQGRVYAVAYRITLNREDALDVTQDVLLKMYRKVGSWEPTSGFLPWLMRLTSNQSIDSIRRRNRRRCEPLDDAHTAASGSSIEPAAQDTEQSVRGKEIGERVQQALRVLSPSQRSVVVMRHYEGLQLAEIASVLGCTVGSVKVHLFRALRKLQDELRDFRNQ